MANDSRTPQLRSEGPFTLVGVGGRFVSVLAPDADNMERIPALWHELMQRASEIEGRVDGVMWGACMPVPDGQPARDGELYYVAGAPVREGAVAPEGMESHTIAPATYAVFTHRGPLSGLGETYRMIHGEWLPASGYHPAAGAELERYDARFDGGEHSEMEIWVPVVPA